MIYAIGRSVMLHLLASSALNIFCTFQHSQHLLFWNKFMNDDETTWKFLGEKFSVIDFHDSWIIPGFHRHSCMVPKTFISAPMTNEACESCGERNKGAWQLTSVINNYISMRADAINYKCLSCGTKPFNEGFLRLTAEFLSLMGMKFRLPTINA